MNLCELLQSPPLSSPGLRGCLAMLGQGEWKNHPFERSSRVPALFSTRWCCCF